VKLPKLRVLKMGAGVWSNGGNFDGMQMGDLGVHAANYLSLNCSYGPSPWLVTDEDIGYSMGEGNERSMEGDKRLLAEQTDLEKDVRAYDGEWFFYWM
jgi:hypothetical protein